MYGMCGACGTNTKPITIIGTACVGALCTLYNYIVTSNHHAKVPCDIFTKCLYIDNIYFKNKDIYIIVNIFVCKWTFSVLFDGNCEIRRLTRKCFIIGLNLPANESSLKLYDLYNLLIMDAWCHCWANPHNSPVTAWHGIEVLHQGTVKGTLVS